VPLRRAVCPRETSFGRSKMESTYKPWLGAPVPNERKAIADASDR
jgi:hypothetical protein